MNKRRQTRSPPLLYLALAVVRARPNRPPLPAKAREARDRAARCRDPRERHLPLEGRHGQGGSGPPGLACRVPGALESGRASSGRTTPAFKSSNALVPIAGGPSSSMPRRRAILRPLGGACQGRSRVPASTLTGSGRHSILVSGGTQSTPTHARSPQENHPIDMRCSEFPRLVALASCFALLATPKGCRRHPPRNIEEHRPKAGRLAMEGPWTKC